MHDDFTLLPGYSTGPDYQRGSLRKTNVIWSGEDYTAYFTDGSVAVLFITAEIPHNWKGQYEYYPHFMSGDNFRDLFGAVEIKNIEMCSQDEEYRVFLDLWINHGMLKNKTSFDSYTEDEKMDVHNLLVGYPQLVKSTYAVKLRGSVNNNV